MMTGTFGLAGLVMLRNQRNPEAFSTIFCYLILTSSPPYQQRQGVGDPGNGLVASPMAYGDNKGYGKFIFFLITENKKHISNASHSCINVMSPDHGQLIDISITDLGAM